MSKVYDHRQLLKHVYDSQVRSEESRCAFSDFVDQFEQAVREEERAKFRALVEKWKKTYDCCPRDLINYLDMLKACIDDLSEHLSNPK